MSQLAPSAQADSYSTLSIRRPLYGPSLISTSFLQATGQAWQVGLWTRIVFVDELAADLLGAVPERRHLAVPGRQGAHRVGDVHQHVGAVDREAALAGRGHVLLVHDRGQRLCARTAGQAGRVGRLRGVAPRLDDDRLQVLGCRRRRRFRHARTTRSFSLIQARNVTMFSPAWPMAMTLRSFSPYSLLKCLIVSWAPWPQRSEASRSSTVPFST